MKKIYKEIWFGIVSFILVVSICFQMRIVNNAGTITLNSYGNDELISEIFKWEKRYNDTTKKVDSQNEIINEYESVINSDGDLTRVLTQELEQSKILLGLSNLKGKGTIVKIDDSKIQPNEEYTIKDLIVHDSDVLLIVSTLKAAGAEAICVNDKRIVSSSEIKCVGPVIEVNNEKLAAPYTIKAIGDADKMEDYINNKSSILQTFRQRTLEVEVYSEENVFIPKYNKKVSSDYLSLGE